VLLAAGVIPSAAILLRSMGCYGKSLQVQDSPYFLIPLVRFRGAAGQEHESMHTMAQAYILIRDERISPSFVHLSVYTYNDLLVPALRAAGGVLARTAGPMWRALAAIPWELMWFGLRSLEALGVNIPVRSDSLVSLVNHPNSRIGSDTGGVRA